MKKTRLVRHTPFLHFLFFSFPALIALPLLALASTLTQSLSTTNATPLPNRILYISEFGMGPDKWASAWLLTRYVKGQVAVFVENEGDKELPNTINTHNTQRRYFDDPRATQLHRGHDHSTFERILETFELTSPELIQMGAMINDIEIQLWRSNTNPYSQWMEDAFRELQRGRYQGTVPMACYHQFFDRVAEVVKKNGKPPSTITEVLPSSDCAEIDLASLLEQPKKMVPELTANDVLRFIRAKKKVVFVDVREPMEYDENHIPNAINLSIRDMDSTPLPSEIRDADVIVAYCVKDFRGFEMARLLRKKDLKQTVIMNPFGLRGWIQAGLPIYTRDLNNHTEAQRALQHCADQPTSCLNPKSASSI